MNKKIFFSVIIAMLPVFSCTNRTPSTDFDGTVIDIVNPSKNFMSFIAGYDTIRLETTDEALIDAIRMLRIMNDRLYILNKTYDKVFIFSRDGKFINRISDVGQGPKEYIKIICLATDPVHNKILIGDSFSKRLFIYDEDGRQERVIPLNFNRMGLASDGADGFVNFYSIDNKDIEEPGMRDYCVHFLDSEGRFVSSQIPLETQRMDVMTGRDFDCHEDGSIFYQPMLSDIIYCIKDKKVIPCYKLQNKSGYRTLSEEERKTMTFLFGEKDGLTEKLESGYIIPFGNIMDTDSYVYTAFGGRNNDEVHLFYNKKTKKSIVFDSDRLSKDESISNLFLKYIGCAKGDAFYAAPDLSWINRALPAMPESKLKTFLENTDADGNPVIISFSIKFPEDTQ
ncbi:MAG: 6-bladed beta-propeller [Tannerella sp.]|jgi:hypothetical protein|nr:6-bladed beta-propeller [Tannerella sp.]